MKKFMLVSVVSIGLVISNLNAQEKKDRIQHEDRMEMRMEKMEKHLELTPEQSKQIREIHAKHHAQQVELRKEMRELRATKKAEFKEVLNDEQYEKMLAFKKEHKYKKKHATCNHPQKKRARTQE